MDAKQDLPDSPLSLWLAEYGSYLPEAALAGDLSVDVAVIGGGFTGLATAIALKRRDPSLEVAVLEAKTIGYGASGRNGSFAMTVIGLGFGTTAMLRGKDFLRRAHAYMERCVDELDRFIDEAGLVCDKIRPGFLRVATTPSYVKRLKRQVELMASLGFDGITWLDGAATREMVDSERYLGAMWEPRLRARQPGEAGARAEALRTRAGVRVFEGSPVLASRRTHGAEPVHRLLTPDGSVTARKLAFATNAYSHLFAPLDRLQVPAFTYMIATAPLTEEQLAPIGWQRRPGDRGRPQPHPLLPAHPRQTDRARRRAGRPHGERQPRPRRRRAGVAAPRAASALAVAASSDVAITHRWGGPFSVTLDLTPALGYVGEDRSAVYALGCIGHGVSMSYLNGEVLTDLLLADGERTRRRVSVRQSQRAAVAARAARKRCRARDPWLPAGRGRLLREHPPPRQDRLIARHRAIVSDDSRPADCRRPHDYLRCCGSRPLSDRAGPRGRGRERARGGSPARCGAAGRASCSSPTRCVAVVCGR